MASRNSYGISNYWKFPRNSKNKNYNKNVIIDKINKFRSILILFKIVSKKKNKYERQMFWLDSFIAPFNKLIGCRITKHNWYYMDDEEEAFCTKCFKRTGYISRDTWKRIEKLKQIKKRTKK